LRDLRGKVLNCLKADKAYGAGVAKALGIPVGEAG